VTNTGSSQTFFTIGNNNQKRLLHRFNHRRSDLSKVGTDTSMSITGLVKRCFIIGS
jgi:hypothetical protein